MPEAILDYVIHQNEPPEFLIEPGELYMDQRVGQRGIIDFGGIFDQEGDDVSAEMKSDPDVTFFRFDKDRAQFQVFPESVEGFYNITLNLTDNNEDEPRHKEYSFFVLLQGRSTIVEEVEAVVNETVVQTQYDNSFMYLGSMDRKG